MNSKVLSVTLLVAGICIGMLTPPQALAWESKADLSNYGSIKSNGSTSSSVYVGFRDETWPTNNWTSRGWLLYSLPNLSGQVAIDRVFFECTISPYNSASWGNFDRGRLYGLWHGLPYDFITTNEWYAASNATRYSWLSGSGMNLLLNPVGEGGSTPESGGRYSLPLDKACDLFQNHQTEYVYFGIREYPESTSDGLSDDTSLVRYLPTSSLTVYYAGAPQNLSPSNGVDFEVGDTITFSWRNDIGDCAYLGYRVQISPYSDFRDNSDLEVELVDNSTMSSNPIPASYLGRYYWRVRTRNKNVDDASHKYGRAYAVSGWSDTRYFDVVAHTTYTLSTSVSPSGGGSVTKNPNKSSYSYNESVQLTANASSGYTFSHWSGNASGSSNPTTITMNSNKSVTAYFDAITYTLGTWVSPSGGGSVTKNPNKSSYTYNEPVQLTANASSGYTFSHWSDNNQGGAIIGSSNPLPTILMNSNKSVTANFIVSTYTLSTSVSPSGGGNVTKNPNKSSYSYNESVQLTANKNPGYTFSHWSGNVAGSSNPTNVTMNSNKSVTANFSGDKPTVSIVAVDSDAGELPPGDTSYPNDGLFRVTRTGITTSQLVVYYNVSGSATLHTDYVRSPEPVGGTFVAIPQGASYADISVRPVDDSIVEGTESIIFTLQSDTAYTVGSPSSATVTIADDDLVGDFCGPDFGPPDGYVDVWDLMQFADHWHTRTGEGNWDGKFDLTGPDFGDADGYVDVWDLMVFADHWHEGVKP